MGCELCQNDNRENIEFKLAREGERPIELKNKSDEENYLDKETYFSYLEERLNEKYSISPNILEELKEKIKFTSENNQLNEQNYEYNNKNNNEYLNLYNNNDLQYNSRNKKDNEGKKMIENDTNINKETTEKDIFETGLTTNKDNLKNEEEIEKLKNNLKDKKDNKDKKRRKKKEEGYKDSKDNNDDLTGNENDENNSNKKKRKDKRHHSHHSHKNKSKEKSKDKNKDKNKEKRKDKSKDKHHRSHSKNRKKSENKEKEKNDNSENKEKEKNDNSENNDNNEEEVIKYIVDNNNNDDEKENNFQNSDDNKIEKSIANDKEKEEENNNNINDNESNNENENNSIIKQSDTKQIYEKTEKINSLLKEIRHSKIDKILKETPKREKTTLEKLIHFFQKHSKKLSSVERAWLIYKWITLHIEYDFEGVGNKNYDISPEATFKRGKTICSGYAGLYKKITDNLELTVERIGGYSKGFNFKLTENIEDSEKHEWNAVQIDKEWFFIETTWGAGYSDDDKIFKKRFTPYFFFTPPIQYVREHLPFDEKWQLLPKSKIVDQKTFMTFAPLKSSFFTLGFDTIEPDFTFNKVKEKGKFILYCGKKKEVNYDNIKIMAKLYLIEDEKNSKEIKNSILEIKKDDYYEVNYYINNKGEYKLKIFGNQGRAIEYNELCTLILISDKDSAKKRSYPSTTGLYYNSDLKIIQPNKGILKEGTKINFEFKTTTYNQLYIGIKTDKGANFMEMSKNNNIFKEEDFLVHGNKVIISCKGEKENSYSTIVEFDVTKSKKGLTYPQVFAGPKNKLIEPICDKLKKGKKVKFEIKSDLIEEMAVADGEELHKLEKNNGVFTGEIRISGKGEVKIAFKKDEGGFGVLYSYKII